MDDLLVTNKGNYRDHLRKLEQVFHKLSCEGLQVNPRKSFWAASECECLDYVIFRDGMKPQPKKVKAVIET